MVKAFARRPSAGFTLVELLVVIIIIAILAGILIPTVNAARRQVLRARVTIEMKQLETAIEQYKTDHGGDYPPDFTDYPVGANPNAKSVNLAAHLARAYPRHNRGNITKWMISQPTTCFGCRCCVMMSSIHSPMPLAIRWHCNRRAASRTLTLTSRA
jgi:prepilin-type N-terminal cleavage/methylation domain-containing protein